MSKIEALSDFDKSLQPIEGIACLAPKIWIDRKGAKHSRYNAEAEKILPFITPELLEDPNFYSNLSRNTHIRVLQLLSTFVPDLESEEFNGDPTHAIIVSYLNGFVQHKELLFSEQNGNHFMSKDLKSKNQAVNLLRVESGMPQYYLDNIFGENVGRPPERNRPEIPLVKKSYSDVVRAPGEQRKS